VDWDDITTQGEVSYGFGHSYDWEAAAATKAHSGEGYKFTTSDDDNSREPSFSWELDVLDGSRFEERGAINTNVDLIITTGAKVERFDFVYSYDWEEAEHDGTGFKYTSENAQDESVIFSWESDISDGSLAGPSGFININPGSDPEGAPQPGFTRVKISPQGVGDTQFVEGDTANSVFGTIGNRAGDSFDQPYGLTSQIIPTDRNLLLIYSILPTPLIVELDQTDWPDFLDKYIIYGTLERAYTANTDGRIQSLSEYWGLRKIAGIEVLKRFKQNQTVDRDYRLTFEGARTRSSRPAQPRLPSNYPVDVSRGSY
jgi:hypothetical protein